MTFRPLPERECLHPDCTAPTRARLGFCPAHYSVAYACVFDASCRNRCAAHSRTRLCQEHAWYTVKLRREQREE